MRLIQLIKGNNIHASNYPSSFRGQSRTNKY